jgi:lipoprotein-releasing system permease protein
MMLEWWMAFKFLAARRSEKFISVIAWFSLLGIVLGVATLIIVMSVMNGFRHEIFAKMLDVSGHVMIRQTDGEPMKNWQDLRKNLLDIQGVEQATPLTEGQALISSQHQALGVLVRGNLSDDILNREGIAQNLTFFDREAFEAGRGILLSQKLAYKLRLSPNDLVSLVAPQGAQTAFGYVPRIKDFKIAGLFDSGTYQIDNGLVFIHLDIANVFFNRPDHHSDMIELRLTQPYEDGKVITELVKKLTVNEQIISWRDLNQTLAKALDVERNVMFLILTLIILVAAFNIITGQIMLVRDKTKTIAILTAMGMTQSAILRIFLICGSMIGIFGTAIGALLGIAFANNIETIRRFLESFADTNLFNEEIYFLSQLPSRIIMEEVITIIALALILSVLAALYPAFKAAKLHPVQGLHHE